MAAATASGLSIHCDEDRFDKQELAAGDDHARVRKIMNPAFNAAQLRSFLPLFFRTARRVSNASSWSARRALMKPRTICR